MEVHLIHRPAFRVAGLEVQTLGLADGEKPSEGEIHRLWDQFRDRIHELAHGVHVDITYGLLTFPADWNPGDSFFYLASVEVQENQGTPAGMRAHTIPENDYAAVTYFGPLDGIGRIWEFFYQEWLPNSGYHQPNDLVAYEFERYDHSYKAPSGEIQMQVWFPVERI